MKYIDRVVNKIEIGIRLLNRLTWLCFLVFVDMKRVVYDRHRSTIKLQSIDVL